MLLLLNGKYNNILFLCFILFILEKSLVCRQRDRSVSFVKAHDNNADQSTFDYIIIGAGPAGSTVATRLSQYHPSNEILVLETGIDVSDDHRTEPTFSFAYASYTNLVRNYFSQEGHRLKYRHLYHMAPKALGGGSVLNAMCWTWGNPHDWDGWVADGLTEWSFDQVLPYFQKVENFSNADPSGLRGKEGPVNVEILPPNTYTTEAVDVAGEVFDLPVVEDNCVKHQSSSILQRTMTGLPLEGKRDSAWQAYLGPASRQQSNLKIMTKATVLKVLIEEQTAVGVLALVDGVTMEIYAKHEVIISAGGYNSAKILLLSGIGNSTELEAVGVKVEHHLPGVGKFLKDHFNPGTISFFGPSFEHYDGNLVAAYAKTGLGLDDLDLPDFEAGYIVFPSTDDKSMWPYIPSIHLFYAIVMRHDGVGHVKLASSDPLEDPEIVSNFLHSDMDMEKTVYIIRRLFDWASRMKNSKDFKQVFLQGDIKVYPGATDAEIRQAAQDAVETHWHSSRTCKMGVESDPFAVVDSRFKVFGISGLRIVDTSVLPHLPTGHPMATVYILGERAADFISEDRG